MSRRSKLVILAGIVLAAALATAAVAIMSWPGDESATPTRAAMPVVKRPSLPAPRPLPRETMTIAVPADTGLGRLTAAHDAVWAAGERGLYRIDPRRNEFTRHVALADAWSVGVAVTDGDVWSGQYDGDLISRIDSITGRVVAQIRVPEPQGIAVSSAAVWVSNHHDGTVSRIDPRTNSVAATIKLSR
jgi:YVTN family beta-propeller protein